MKNILTEALVNLATNASFIFQLYKFCNVKVVSTLLDFPFFLLYNKKERKKKKEERKELEQEYENLKLLASFHEAYGVPENEKEREALINDILDRMNEIREKLKE